MKFADNGYYIESYSKCSNCGVLIFEATEKATRRWQGQRFCSQWCEDWYVARNSDLSPEALVTFERVGPATRPESRGED